MLSRIMNVRRVVKSSKGSTWNTVVSHHTWSHDCVTADLSLRTTQGRKPGIDLHVPRNCQRPTPEEKLYIWQGCHPALVKDLGSNDIVPMVHSGTQVLHSPFRRKTPGASYLQILLPYILGASSSTTSSSRAPSDPVMGIHVP